ncbi:MAG: hypothetical protein D6714_14260, partial [Bacteroidetes bacterium]
MANCARKVRPGLKPIGTPTASEKYSNGLVNEGRINGRPSNLTSLLKKLPKADSCSNTLATIVITLV